MLLIVGIECMVIDSATLGKAKVEQVKQGGGWLEEPKTVEVTKGGRKVDPPEWMPGA